MKQKEIKLGRAQCGKKQCEGGGNKTGRALRGKEQCEAAGKWDRKFPVWKGTM